MDADFGIILCVFVATTATLYALLCDIRSGRIARAAVNHLRSTHPASWQSLPWVYRRLAGPSITIRLLRRGVTDEQLERQFMLVRRAERRKLFAVGVTLLYVGIALVGSKLWGWSWG